MQVSCLLDLQTAVLSCPTFSYGLALRNCKKEARACQTQQSRFLP